MRLIDQDQQFFEDHKDRHARIREPIGNEMSGEFFSLGDHDKTRRRIIVWRVPKDNPYWRKDRTLLKIPFLMFADESIEDDDIHVMPLLNEIMTSAAQGIIKKEHPQIIMGKLK